MTRDSDSQGAGLFDDYLDALLRGDIEDPASFCRRRGQDPGMAQTLDGIYRMVLERVSSTRDADDLLQPDEALPHQKLGDFRLIRRLGEGGMGIVYLAQQESLGRLVAVKVIRPEFAGSPTAAQRFEREARVIARLRNPNIVSVHTVGEDAGVRYLAMDLIPGKSLAEVIDEAAHARTTVPVSVAVGWVSQLADALHYAHGEGVIHRDVKPSNIRITHDGRPLLLDFGLAREVDSASRTLTQSFAGSPSYASPEQIGGHRDLDGRSDVYSLGVTLYELLTGSVPFSGDDIARLMQKILVEEPPPARGHNPAITRDLEVVCSKAMEKDADRRYESAAAFAADLHAVLELRPIRARPAGAVTRSVKWARRNRVATGALLAALAVGALAITFFFARARSEEKRAGAEASELIAAARARLEEFDGLRSSFEEADWRRRNLETAQVERWVEPSENEELQRSRILVDSYQKTRETAFAESLELLSQAERLDPDAQGLADTRAFFYYLKWLDLRSYADLETLTFYEGLVREHDVDGHWTQGVEGRSQVEFRTEPPGAEIFLLSNREQAEVDVEGAHRLVPVPVQGEAPAVRPGTWALRVVQGSEQLTKRDVILEVAGHAIQETILAVRRVPAREDTPMTRSHFLGDMPLRIRKIDGHPIKSRFDVEQTMLRGPREGASFTFVFTGPGAAAETTTIKATDLAALGLEAVLPEELVRRGNVVVKASNGAALRELELERGVETRTTAAPILVSAACRLGVSPLEARPMDPGNYLAICRLEGYEDLRISFHVDHATEQYSHDLALKAVLHPVGTTPEGFTRISADVFPWWEEAYWIMEREVTCGEYLSFLNDPATLAEVDASATLVRVPRPAPDGAPFPTWPRVDGSFRLPPGVPFDWPVLGVSWEDAQAYATWRNRARDEITEGLEYGLPTLAEWRWAGLGGDQRSFPFGRRFAPHWMNSLYSRSEPAVERVRSYPIDESPFGVFDIGGSVSEWLQDDAEDGAPGEKALAGGAWNRGTQALFQVGHARALDRARTESSLGFRLVVRSRAR